MHINILQYKHYLKKHNRERELNRIILLTPNEGLSQQHLGEFELSNIEADLFSKEGRSLYSSGDVEIIDIHKLREESGEKTVAVEAFEGNNLVMVDEGHRGASSSEVGLWMQRRNQLCENGFSFEYSATFGQSIKASRSKPLEQTYCKCILLDYSYKYFYGDGYGKEYQILNLEDDSDEVVRKKYLVACLLAFYQQQKLYRDRQFDFKKFLIENPLCVFVGGSVYAVRTQGGREVSDVLDILLFIAELVANKNESIEFIKLLLAGNSGLLDARGNSIFGRSFIYLNRIGLTAEQMFDDILKVLFNAGSAASLHIENLKGTDGEIALRLGENEPFGLVNVGDAPALCKLCEKRNELVVAEREFSGSLFHSLDHAGSEINILIGSKKFTEGWSSWRVSTMGLMNIGRSEGAQIIQLFGRGVRLKGLDFCLKRSHRILGVKAPEDINVLETLNIFGIRADYMRQFREYLEEEGLPTNENRIEFILPVLKNLGEKKLKTIRVKEGVDFKRQGRNPKLDIPDEWMKRNRIVLDWYPKIQALASSSGQSVPEFAERQEANFTEQHIAFMDIDEISFELQRFKNERAWYNLNLSKADLVKLLQQPDWYQLFIPEDELKFGSFERVQRWQEIAVGLLKKYCDRYYKYRKAEFESHHLEYHELSEDDENFFDEYQLLIEESRRDIVAKLTELKSLIESGALREAEFNKLEFELSGVRAISFGRHLYQPLIYAGSSVVEIKPVVLENAGEKQFVLDLKKYCEENSAFFSDKELYLLRNMSRGKGIGFFEAGNFYPDFILWLLNSNNQHISFVDPKGLRNLRGKEDPKIAFHKTIKEIERDLSAQAPHIKLNSFIISSTPFLEINWWGMSKHELEQCNVLFQQEDMSTYIGKIITHTLA